MSRITPILLSAALLLPLASGDAPDALTAQEARAHGAHVSADVAVLKLLADANGRPPPQFELESPVLRVEADQAERVVETVQRTYVNPTMEPSEHRNARVVGLSNGGEARWALDALSDSNPPMVTFSTSCVGLQPADRPSETTPAIVRRDDRPDRVADLAQTLLPASCNEPFTVTVAGAFRLSLWDWTARLDTADGTQTLETGIRPRSDGTGNEATETYLFVADGTLTLTLQDAPSAFYVHAPHVTADRISLRSAAGTLEGNPLRPGGQDVTLYNAEARLLGQGVGQPLHVTLPPGSTDLNPATTAPSSPIPAPAWTWPVLALAAILAALLVRQRPLIHDAHNTRRGRDTGSILPQTRRERRGRGYWVLAKLAHHAKRHRIALHYARRAHTLFPILPETRLMLATALSHRRRDAEALNHYLAAAGTLDNHRKKAQANLGAAISNAHLGQLGAALDRFALVAQLAPDLARKRLGHPTLLRLNDQPRFAAIRRSLEDQATPASRPPSEPDVA